MRRPGFAVRFVPFTFAVVLATTFIACSDGDEVTVPPPPVAVTLTVIPASLSLTVGHAAVFLTARAADKDHRAVSTVVTWTSSNPDIATIGRTEGRVTALAAGTTTMTATAGALSAIAVVIVHLPVATTIRLSLSDVVLAAGETYRVTAQVLDQNGQPMDTPITWSSQSPSVASVSADGTVTGTSIGTTRVVATSGAATTEVAVRVEPAGFLMQWARSATASSQYGNESWAPTQATGAPNVSLCDDESLAWASLDTSVDWLELTYDQPVRPSEIRIHEVWAPGSIVKVEIKDMSGNYLQVYSASPQPFNGCLRTLTIQVSGVTEYITTVRVTVDQRALENWNEIDAVRLTGFRRP